MTDTLLDPPPNPFGHRILVLIPHPDDEVVGCHALIKRAQAEGSKVYGVYLGHGCIAKQTLWPWQRKHYDTGRLKRLAEAATVAEKMGIQIAGINSTRSAREIWRNLKQVRGEVNAAMDRTRPDIIWVPAFEGGNPDHDALNALAGALGRIQVFEFAEYHLARGVPISNRFINPRGDETVIQLGPEEKREKRKTLAMYESEQGNLSSIGVDYESIRPLQRYDYSQPPHKGKLWYERFQWVPFKHPRVDYTKGVDVATAIIQFLGRS